MSDRRTLARSVVRVTARNAQGGLSFGSGVVVTTATILTARHVVDPDGLSMQGQQPDPRQLRLQGSALGSGVGLVTVDELRFPDDPEVDLALAILHPPKTAEEDCRCALPGHDSPVVNVGDPLACFGFSRVDGPVEEDRLLLQSVHGHAGVFVCRHAVAQGYSGGPAFSGEMMVGITYARHLAQGQSFVHTGHALRQLLTDKAVGAWQLNEGSVHVLRQYPLGPAMSPNEMAARLSRLIERCVILHTPQQAIALIDSANQLRIECGPDTDEKGLIQSAHLPSPLLDLFGYWHQAFAMACRKSPRMLAALLLSLDAVAFSTSEIAARDDVLRRLRLIGQVAR